MTVRQIDCGEVADTVARLCMEANFELREDVLRALRAARAFSRVIDITRKAVPPLSLSVAIRGQAKGWVLT